MGEVATHKKLIFLRPGSVFSQSHSVVRFSNFFRSLFQGVQEAGHFRNFSEGLFSLGVQGLTAGGYVAVLWGFTMAHAEESKSGYEWMPTEAEHAGAQQGPAAPLHPLTITTTPKPTADASRFTKVYTLELEKFGIRKDGTEAEATSKGINAALRHAKTLNANRIVFPAGTYLINVNDPVILDHQDTIVDLNGATLQAQANSRSDYTTVEIWPEAKNLRLTNGTLRGDREEHDYKTVKGTHEGCAGLAVLGGDNLEIDHLHVTQFPGIGVTNSSTGMRNREELLAHIYYLVERKNMEFGGFSGTGEKVDDSGKLRSITPYAIGGERNQFELGYNAGYMGFPWILGRAYQVIFLDENQQFLEKRDVLQYRKVQVPEKARFLHLEFNQSEIAEEPAHPASTEFLVRITNFLPSTDVHFHDNLMDFNRSLGLSGVGQRWLIEKNRVENNGGIAPGYGIDLEDGWEMMQDVVFRGNSFQDNEQGDIVICAGSEILVEENDFTNKVVFHGRAYNYTMRNNRLNGGYAFYTTRSGIATITGNTYRDVKRVEVTFDGRGFADGIVRKQGENVGTPPLLSTRETFEDVGQVKGTYINYRDSKFTNTKLVAGEETRLVALENCAFENSTLDISDKGGKFIFREKNNTGELSVIGNGQERIQAN